MNMPFRDDAALVQVNSALGAYQSDGRTACDISRFADGRFHSQFQGVCGGYFHLRFTAARPEYAHVFDGAKFQPDDGDALFRGELAAHQIFFLM